MSEITRRAFLQIAAGAGAAAAVTYGSKTYEKLVPYVTPPAETTPGEWSHIATTCRECPAGCGMILWHRNGRVTKAEGNPNHPINAGGLCPRGQSALQGLYDPARLKRPIHRTPGQSGGDSPIAWDSAIKQIAEAMSKAKHVILISDLQTGTMADVLNGFTWATCAMPVFFEPFSNDPLRQAHQELFGRGIIPDYRLQDSRFIISFGADFLESWISPVQFARRFSAMRAYDEKRKDMGRFVYIGPRFSATAANADEFIQVAPGEMTAMAEAMLTSVKAQLPTAKSWITDQLPPLASSQPLPAGVTQQRINALAATFIKAQGGIALAGPVGADGDNATALCRAAATMNYLASTVAWSSGRPNTTVDFAAWHAMSSCATRAQIEQTLADLDKKTLLIINNAALAYAIPGTAAALRKAACVVYMGTMDDSTAAAADYVLPTDYPLEAWGDYEPQAGVHSLLQPTMGRMYDTRNAGDILIALANAHGKDLKPRAQDKPVATFEEALHARWEGLRKQLAPSINRDEFWRESLRAGGRWERISPAEAELKPPDNEPSKPGAATKPTAQSKSDSPTAGVDLWLWGSSLLHDGRVANRSWLQEAPDPMTSIVWGNCLQLHPTTAEQLHLAWGNVARVATPHGEVTASVIVTDDVAPGVAALAFGGGHGDLGPTAAKARGGNAFALLSAASDSPFGRATITPTGEQAGPISLSATQEQLGRKIVQWVDLPALRAMNAGDGDKLILPLPEGYREGHDLFTPREYVHRWAMVADMHKCIGCGACAVACYAENNIPTTGPGNCSRGLEMAWLKIVPYRQDADDAPGRSPRRVGFLPMLCQHCDAAPCEPVCPVYAAVHNDQGLNAQVYNRCIGTRYCSNNCPYKVRRFNWVNIDWTKPTDWQLNPEVTVRSRGVMEKCTFCIQRIRGAQHQARKEGRPVRDGEVKPACVQSCPTGAYTFGDLMDPESAVTKLTRENPRRYHVLESLNTKPAVTYLRRIVADEPL